MTNDRIILDKILEQKHQEVAPTLAASKYFEIFTAGEIVKDYDLSYDEIEEVSFPFEMGSHENARGT